MYLVAIVIGILYTAAVIMPVMGRMIDKNKLDARYIKEDLDLTLKTMAPIKNDITLELYEGINKNLYFELEKRQITIRGPKITEKLFLPTNLQGEISNEKILNLTKKGSNIALGEKGITTCANIDIPGKIKIEENYGAESFANRAKTILKSKITNKDESIYIKYIKKQDTQVYIDADLLHLDALECNLNQIKGITTIQKQRHPECTQTQLCIVIETNDMSVAQEVARLFT